MNKLRPLAIALGFILAAGIFFAVGMGKPYASAQAIRSETIETALPPIAMGPGRAEQVMKALAAAYPRSVLRAEFRNGDWAVLLMDKWFYYANGRLLPEELRDRESEYSPIAFYNYQRELAPWAAPSAEQASRFRDMGNQRSTRRPRSHYFFDALYRAHNRGESYDRVKTLRFLGHPVTVHSTILEDLSLVEERILKVSGTDPQVRTWINNISNLEGWSWRNVADTESRSFHSYGAAIDILPRSLGGRVMYWLWAGPAWWNIPYGGRYHPPDAVVKIFESYGFVWGGKWLFFDTMHFEYRPEVFILSGIEMETLR